MPALEEPEEIQKKQEYHAKFTGYNKGSNGNQFHLSKIGFKFYIDGTLKGFIKYATEFNKQRCAFQGEWKDKGQVSFTYSIKYDDGDILSYVHTANLTGSILNGDRFTIEGDYKRTDGGSKGTFKYDPYVLDPDYQEYESVVEGKGCFKYQYSGQHKNSAGNVFELEYVCLTYNLDHTLKGVLKYTPAFAGTKRCTLEGTWEDSGKIKFFYSLKMDSGSSYSYNFEGRALGNITSGKRFRIEGDFTRTDGGSKGTWVYSPIEWDPGFSD